MRLLSGLEAKVFNQLNELFEVGGANILSTRRYITKTFDLNKHKSIELLYLWRYNFKENKVWNKGDIIEQ